MCGIFGFYSKTNQKKIKELIFHLKKLEYRGYDSSGIFFKKNNEFKLCKKKGNIDNLKNSLSDNLELETNLGILHTRWATHGEPNDINSHPHSSNSGDIVLVHNGILENYDSIKKMLIDKNFTFKSETDSEVIANFLEYINNNNQDNDFLTNIKMSLKLLEGTFGLIIFNKNEDKLYALSKSSPLIIGIDNNSYYLSSDYYSFIEKTNNIIKINDNQIAILDTELIIEDMNSNLTITPYIEKINVNIQDINKSYFKHFMLKEIINQTESLTDCMRGRINNQNIILGGLQTKFKSTQQTCLDILSKSSKIVLCACGTSLHSAMIGKYIIEELANISVEYEQASEFRYRHFVKQENSCYIFISQSGETADTIEALKLVKKHNIPSFGICNVIGSQISRLTDGGVYLHVGPEIGVASTKAFTGQVLILYLIALSIAQSKKINHELCNSVLDSLTKLPDIYKTILNQCKDKLEYQSKLYKYANNFLFLGRGYNYPIALEAALKLKEISYIHAEGYSASEMKHGPIALIDKTMPVVIIANKDNLYQKVKSNILEVKSRGGNLIILTNEGNTDFDDFAEIVIKLPNISCQQLYPFINILPLQLMSYYIATERGCNVDRPRNLAKCVTVE